MTAKVGFALSADPAQDEVEPKVMTATDLPERGSLRKQNALTKTGPRCLPTELGLFTRFLSRYRRELDLVTGQGILVSANLMNLLVNSASPVSQSGIRPDWHFWQGLHFSATACRVDARWMSRIFPEKNVKRLELP